MQFKNLLVAFLLLFASSLVDASPVVKSPASYGGQCKSLKVRKERSLTLAERKSYIDAVKCLKKSPPAEPNPYPAVKSLFDSFQAVHIVEALYVHWAGPFFAFHRLFMWTYEQELAKCGWEGGQPYWSWAMDVEAGSMEQNPMFDDETGFGGNGVYVAPEDQVSGPQFSSPLLVPAAPSSGNSSTAASAFSVPGTGGGCVPGGPFSESQGWIVPMGDDLNTTEYHPHCLRRDFTFSAIQTGANRTWIEVCLDKPDYGSFHRCCEGTLDPRPNMHGSGHAAIGGEQGNVWSSPGDPLFYMHHTNLDRVWWIWQKKNAPHRFHETGNNLVTFDFVNTVARNTTLGVEVDFGVLHSGVEIKDLGNIESSPWCYTYADPPSSI